ncbi:tyrosine-type recombinase/integrase [Pseudalkalibacillus hwajinpoensis]|uniref:tyrosine-type recombinase/integrase n=1 Tax=Guptibacillus hwajinpoensis TaxID=208199 RepID=UPI00146CCAE2|nr:tyrosine-type recombinase/integrase [Pseudalkalibacillus hwajinpoensis]
MNYVGPIHSKTNISKLKKALLNRSERDYLLMVVSLNTGLRLASLLRLTYADVMKDGLVKDYLDSSITGTTGIYLNSSVKRALKLYISHTSTSTSTNFFIFHTRKSIERPITRQQVHRILSRAANEALLDQPISYHSLRKTFGYHAYQQGVAVSLIQKIYGHATRNETLKYIGIKSEDIPKLKIDVNL